MCLPMAAAPACFLRKLFTLLFRLTKLWEVISIWFLNRKTWWKTLTVVFFRRGPSQTFQTYSTFHLRSTRNKLFLIFRINFSCRRFLLIGCDGWQPGRQQKGHQTESESFSLWHLLLSPRLSLCRMVEIKVVFVYEFIGSNVLLSATTW